WIFGFMSTNSLVNNSIMNRDLFGNSFFNIVYSLTMFHPFWTGFKPAVFQVQPVPVAQFILPFFVSLFFILKARRKNYYFVFVFLLGVFLSKQTADPFGELYEMMFNFLPGFKLFREASKFYSLVAIGSSILL